VYSLTLPLSVVLSIATGMRRHSTWPTLAFVRGLPAGTIMRGTKPVTVSIWEFISAFVDAVWSLYVSNFCLCWTDPWLCAALRPSFLEALTSRPTSGSGKSARGISEMAAPLHLGWFVFAAKSSLLTAQNRRHTDNCPCGRPGCKRTRPMGRVGGSSDSASGSTTSAGTVFFPPLLDKD